MMKNLVLAALAATSLGLVACDETTTTRTREQSTNMDGTAVERTTTTETTNDGDGNMTRETERKTTVDPEGLMNKQTDTQTNTETRAHD